MDHNWTIHATIIHRKLGFNWTSQNLACIFMLRKGLLIHLLQSLQEVASLWDLTIFILLIYGINIYIYIYIYTFACVYLRCSPSDKSLSFLIWTKLGCNYASSSILHCTALIPCIPYHRNNNKSMNLDGSYDYLVDLYKRYTRYTRMVWYCMMQPLIPWLRIRIHMRVLAVMCSIHYWTPNEARTSITASNLISPRPLPLPLPNSLPRPRKSPLSLPPPHLRYFVMGVKFATSFWSQ